VNRAEAMALAAKVINASLGSVSAAEIADAIESAYYRGLAEGRRDRITLSQDADSDQSAQD